MNQDYYNKSGGFGGGTTGSFGVEFVGERQQGVQNFYGQDSSGVIQWTIKYSGGLIKDKKTASYFLLGCAALLIFVSIFLIFSSLGPKVPAGALKNPSYGLPAKN